MRSLLTCLLAVALLARMGQGQSFPQAPQPGTSAQRDDAARRRLGHLTSDSHVTITAHGDTVHCQSLRVIDVGLTCEFESWLFPTRNYRISRGEIERVRLRHDKRNFWIGVGAASMGGLIFGATRDTVAPRGVAAVEMGTIFGFGSALFVYPAVRLIPGETIYHRQP